MRIIAGRWRGHPIQAPPGRRTRPTSDRVREAWMSMIAPLLPDARVLDLFAGSGALGLEALSRGAAHATLVERAGRALETIRANAEALGAGDAIEIVRADALAYVDGLEERAFDIALADPPYGRGGAAALARRFADAPFAGWLWLEHRVSDALPELDGLDGGDSRRYGDTVLTSVPAPVPS